MTMDAELRAGLRERAKATWSSGDFAAVGTMIQVVGETLCESIGLRAGQEVLDVATGSGNTALAAARRFTKVTGVDFVPALLERARVRAIAEGMRVEFLEGDAEELPVPDASFDVVLSTFGVMFAPDHARAAGELLRVLRPGGRIGLSSWVPDGVAGDMFRTVAEHAPPPPEASSALLWGTSEHLHQLFPDTLITITRRTVNLVMPSADFWVEFFASNFGPVLKAFEAVGEQGAAALEADLRAFLARSNISGDDTLVLPQDYLDAVITV